MAAELSPAPAPAVTDVASGSDVNASANAAGIFKGLSGTALACLRELANRIATAEQDYADLVAQFNEVFNTASDINRREEIIRILRDAFERINPPDTTEAKSDTAEDGPKAYSEIVASGTVLFQEPSRGSLEYPEQVVPKRKKTSIPMVSTGEKLVKTGTTTHKLNAFGVPANAKGIGPSAWVNAPPSYGNDPKVVIRKKTTNNADATRTDYRVITGEEVPRDTNFLNAVAEFSCGVKAPIGWAFYIPGASQASGYYHQRVEAGRTLCCVWDSDEDRFSFWYSSP